MARLAPLLIGAAVAALQIETRADPGTRFRDHLVRDHPVVNQLRSRLGIKPLPKEAGKAVVRIWDDRASFTLSVSGNAVTVEIVHGHGTAWFSIVGEWDGIGRAEPNAKDRLETRTTQYAFDDAALARDAEYIVANITRFDRHGIGLDGGYTFVDAVDASGKVSTFENWSPDPIKDPLATELGDIFGTFWICTSMTYPAQLDWQPHEKANFMTRFPEATSLNLTPAKARIYVEAALRKRISSLATELRNTKP